jgi:hypothetical protein
MLQKPIPGLFRTGLNGLFVLLPLDSFLDQLNQLLIVVTMDACIPLLIKNKLGR